MRPRLAGRWLRLPRSRLGRLGVLAALLALVTGAALGLWPTARALAVEVNDFIGLRLVEGHADLIDEAARESRVDPCLLGAIMFMESRGRSGQTSHAGAHGLMQLMPSAAGDAARRLGLAQPTVEELKHDARLNLRLGAAHLAWLLENRGRWDLEAVLVSYNAGRARLFGWIDAQGGYAAWRARELERHAAGEPTTGTLEYAARALRVRELLRERGAIRPVPGLPSLE